MHNDWCEDEVKISDYGKPHSLNSTKIIEIIGDVGILFTWGERFFSDHDSLLWITSQGHKHIILCN